MAFAARKSVARRPALVSLRPAFPPLGPPAYCLGSTAEPDSALMAGVQAGADALVSH